MSNTFKLSLTTNPEVSQELKKFITKIGLDKQVMSVEYGITTEFTGLTIEGINEKFFKPYKYGLELLSEKFPTVLFVESYSDEVSACYSVDFIMNNEVLTSFTYDLNEGCYTNLTNHKAVKIG